jgi:PleD family two-component response regulator
MNQPHRTTPIAQRTGNDPSRSTPEVMEGERVLLVEDDAAIGALLEHSLRAHGYEVVWARTGHGSGA